MLLRLPLASNPSTSQTQADDLPLCFAVNCILALRWDQMDVLCPRALAGGEKEREKLKPPLLHCVLRLSAMFDFPFPPTPRFQVKDV